MLTFSHREPCTRLLSSYLPPLLFLPPLPTQYINNNIIIMQEDAEAGLSYPLSHRLMPLWYPGLTEE